MGVILAPDTGFDGIVVLGSVIGILKIVVLAPGTDFQYWHSIVINKYKQLILIFLPIKRAASKNSGLTADSI